jgi:hypothetical protein
LNDINSALRLSVGLSLATKVYRGVAGSLARESRDFLKARYPSVVIKRENIALDFYLRSLNFWMGGLIGDDDIAFKFVGKENFLG